MASNVQQCDICTEDSCYVDAVNWCTECHQWLCVNCSKYHSRLASTKTHNLLSEDEYRKLPKSASDVNRKCKKHPDHDLEFYCNNHIEVVCFTCMKDVHSLCKNINKLKDVAVGIKSSAAVTDVISRMEETIEIYKKLEKDRSDNKQNLTKEMTAINSKVDELLQEHKRHLDKMASDLKAEVMLKYTAESSVLLEENKKFKERREKLERKHTDVKAMVEYASDTQMFLSLEGLNKGLSEEESFLQSCERKILKKSLHFKINPNAIRLNQVLSSYGEVSVQSDTSSVNISGVNRAIVPTLQRTAQTPTLAPRTINKPTRSVQFHPSTVQFHPSTFQLVRRFPIPSSGGARNPTIVRDMKCLSNGYVALTDMANNRVVMIDQHGNVMLQEYLPGSPRCLVFTQDGRIAVTLFDEKKVIMWNPYTPKNKETIDIGDQCTGIACVENELIINCQRHGLVLYNITGGTKRRLTPYTGQMDLCFCEKPDLGLCMFKAKTNEFIILDLKTEKETDRFKVYFEKPSCLAKDDDDNFYAICSENSVHKIYTREKGSEKILAENYGITKAQAIATYVETKKTFFNIKTSSKLYLFIANENGNTICMFEKI